jgi:hypothetical protein
MAAVYASQRFGGDPVYASNEPGSGDITATFVITEVGDGVSATAVVGSVENYVVGVVDEAGDTVLGYALVETVGDVVMAPSGARRYALRESSATFPRMQ